MTQSSKREEAAKAVRDSREVDFTGEGWDVISTDGSYPHHVVLARDAKTGELFPSCDCAATPAKPCWAVGKVRQSGSFQDVLARFSKGQGLS